MDFSFRANENAADLEKRVRNLFGQVHSTFGFIFEPNEKIEIDGLHLQHVVSELEAFALLDADRDVIGDAFEELIGTAFRGGEGQFFTPRNVVQMMSNVLQPATGERIIDPACGSGGFLAHVAGYLIHTGTTGARIVGIEKDLFLSRLARIYLSLLGQTSFHVFCENSLENPRKWKPETRDQAKLESFDVILTNPPFGAKIPVVGDELLQQYELGYDWEEKNDHWTKTKTLLDKQPPQILFIERCLQLLKVGGRAGIILPEGIFGNPSERYIWQFLQENASVLGVVSLSQETFQPSTHTKTSVLFLEKTKTPKKQIFMGIADAVGHDKNGKEVYRFQPNGLPATDENGKRVLDDDLPEITRNFKAHLNGGLHKSSHLGFSLNRKAVARNVFIPEYYNPEIQSELEALEQSGKYKLITIGKLLAEKIIEIMRG
ncbi:MAG TPA: N-6 DNA methylase, partial [Pyrinomonadaceae bacterium]